MEQHHHTQQQQTNENKVTYDNLVNYKTKEPFGYCFSKKKLTIESKKRLAGYWLQTANINDKMMDGEINSNDPWLIKYKQSQLFCLNYLISNGFVKPKI